MRHLWKALATAALAFSTSMATAQDRARIVTVNYPLQYFAERLLDGAAEVVFPVPEGVDPSFWRPSVADISLIQSADLILLNGAGFAAWLDRVSLPRSRLVKTSAAIRDRFIVTESITHSHGDGGEHAHEGLASYLWLDPTLAIAQAEAIATALAAKQLAPADQVFANFARLRDDLQALDAKAQAALSDLQDVPMIATHPRYQYLARRYGLSITSLEWEAGAAPTDAELAKLQTLATDTGASILIWEAEPPAGAIEAAKALGLRSVTFPPMAAALSDGPFLSTFDASVARLSKAAGSIAGD